MPLAEEMLRITPLDLREKKTQQGRFSEKNFDAKNTLRDATVKFQFSMNSLYLVTFGNVALIKKRGIIFHLEFKKNHESLVKSFISMLLL